MLTLTNSVYKYTSPPVVRECKCRTHSCPFVEEALTSSLCSCGLRGVEAVSKGDGSGALSKHEYLEVSFYPYLETCVHHVCL